MTEDDEAGTYSTGDYGDMAASEPTDDVAPAPAIGDITREANDVVTAERDTHGDAYDNHKQIAELWTAFMQYKLQPGTEIEPYEVAIMMTQVKASRMQAGTLDKDHFRDIAGYADVAWDSAVRHPETEVEHE